MGASHAGKLLVATPAITDPNFFRTVVLLCTHDGDGAFGLVLNRPAEGARVVDHLAQWGEHAAAPPVVFVGGPVEPTAAFVLGRFDEIPGVPEWTPVVGRAALLPPTGTPDEVGGRLAECRVFAGYAGWGAGQLEGEIESGGWFVVTADEADAFSSDPAQLWRSVLARQSGEMRLYSYFPADPRVN